MERWNLHMLLKNGYSTRTTDFEMLSEALYCAIELMDQAEIIGWSIIDFYDAHKSETDYNSLDSYPVIAQSPNWHTLI